MKEIYGLLKYNRKRKALELDTKIRLAGDKKGNPELADILNEEIMEETADINTDETTDANKAIISTIENIVQKG